MVEHGSSLLVMFFLISQGGPFLISGFLFQHSSTRLPKCKQMLLVNKNIRSLDAAQFRSEALAFSRNNDEAEVDVELLKEELLTYLEKRKEANADQAAQE